MNDPEEFREQLLEEVDAPRARVASLELLAAQHRKAEESLRLRTAELEEIRHSRPHLGFRLDQDGTIRDYKAGLTAQLYLPPEQFLGRRMQDILPPEAGRRFDQAICRVNAGEEPTTIHYSLPMPDGPRDYEASLLRLGTPEILVFVRDVTEDRRLEEALRESERRYRLISELTSDYVYSVRLDRTPTVDELGGLTGEVFTEYTTEWVTEAFTAITGYTTDEVSALGGWLHVIHPDDLPGLRPFNERLLAGHPAVAEYHIRTRGGEIRRLRDYCHPVQDAVQGRVGRLYGAVQDVTERRRLEEQFRQSHKMEAIGTLAGGVAHDFNNLLTVINGDSEILINRLAPGDPLRELVSEILQAGEQAGTLTRQLLTFSRQQVLEPKVLDLEVILSDLEKLLRRLIGEDILLTTVYEPALGLVKVDPGQMQQLLVNLAVNARDAMPQGGRLTIELRNATVEEGPSPSHPGVPPGRYALLSVGDSGTGMDEATKARIFEPFFTTKGAGKGTGLGLAVVHGIVTQSEGLIAVFSEPGQGTTFQIYFPHLQDRVPSSPSHPALLTTMPQGSETVLLVEDDAAVRALARHVLRSCGYTVLEAADGREAVRLVESHPRGIDLLISDVVMPHLGGRQLAKRLTALEPGMKVLFSSGYTDDAVVRHGVQAAEFAFLQKPFTPPALAQKVREVLDQ